MKKKSVDLFVIGKGLEAVLVISMLKIYRLTFYSSEKTYRNIENKVIIVKFIFIYYTEGLLHTD